MKERTRPRHFLDLSQITTAEFRHLLTSARDMKAAAKGASAAGAGFAEQRCLAMIFDKPSTRTRVSFERAMQQLGGATIMMHGDDLQRSRGETIGDTARVLSRYVDAIVLRTADHEALLEFAAAAEVPVINGLTTHSHPCQILADIMTYEEHRGSIEGRRIAWCGDANNVMNSWIEAAAHFAFHMHIATPISRLPDPDLLAAARRDNASIALCEDAAAAVENADLVITDAWISMGESKGESDADYREQRHSALRPYQINQALMARAKPDALFMHCLPAHRGEEVTDAVIDGPQSVVFDEAENRLHSQKAILKWILS